MARATMTPAGPYRLRLMAPSGTWSAPLPDGTSGRALQESDGTVTVEAATDTGLTLVRFMLALDADTSGFHERFDCDPLLGATARALRGWRPVRTATVAHATLKAFCGQLVQASRAREIERAVLRSCGVRVMTQDTLARLAPAELRRCGLAASRAASLVRLARSIDLEGLHAHPTAVVRARLERERGVGPWTTGVLVTRGLGRFDHGIVGDLELIRLASVLAGRWVDAGETAALLDRYAPWQGLAAEALIRGFARRLLPAADPDRARALPRAARAA